MIDEMAAASPVINLVNGLIQRAVRDGASDIHIEPSRTRSLVRFRIDGVLYEVLHAARRRCIRRSSRASRSWRNLDIAEQRMPQDGRIQVDHAGHASRPALLIAARRCYGEKVVLRVLDKNQSILDLDKLGMPPRQRSRCSRRCSAAATG